MQSSHIPLPQPPPALCYQLLDSAVCTDAVSVVHQPVHNTRCTCSFFPGCSRGPVHCVPSGSASCFLDDHPGKATRGSSVFLMAFWGASGFHCTSEYSPLSFLRVFKNATFLEVTFIHRDRGLQEGRGPLLSESHCGACCAWIEDPALLELPCAGKDKPLALVDSI